MTEDSLDKIRSLFKCPVVNRMRYYFFAAENNHGEILGFAQMSYSLDLNFCFLDLLANNPAKRTGGIGEALYNRVREEAKFLNATGLFLECMSDDPDLLSDNSLLKQNRARLKFYERLGARPLINPPFEKHCSEYYGNPYFLLFDNLGIMVPLTPHELKKIFIAIVERKHNKAKDDKSVKEMLDAMKDYQVGIRPPKYSKTEPLYKFFDVPDDRKIPVLYNEGHEIHHIT
jgi:GNAT superfamily N-acetyltransferase